MLHLGSLGEMEMLQYVSELLCADLCVKKDFQGGLFLAM
jgi:hypothetical protein